MLIVQELRDVLWAGKQEVVVDNIVDLTVPMALFIIGVAGFGKRMSWKEDLAVPKGYAMSFKVRDDCPLVIPFIKSRLRVAGRSTYSVE